MSRNLCTAGLRILHTVSKTTLTEDAFVLTSKMRNKENSTSGEEVSNQNLETEDFYDDDVFDVDEEIGSGGAQDDFFTTKESFFDFRTRSSFRALLLKTYSSSYQSR